MLRALLHGKVSPDTQGQEDYLTSCVFGVMKYLPAERLLLPYLGCAIRWPKGADWQTS